MRSFARAALYSLPLVVGACQTVDFGPLDSGSEASEEGMPDPDPQYNCDPGNPTACPGGQKCTAVELNGVQNLYECVDDTPTIMPYASCEPDPVSGQDGCPVGFLCVSDDGQADMGICLPHCSADGTCTGLCSPAPVTDVPVCGDVCSPIDQDCPSVLQCLANGDSFACRYPDALDDGTLNDPCDGNTLEGCAEGFGCWQGTLINGCTTSHCCTPFCDLEATDPGCPSPGSCQPYADGTPPPGQENLGICIVPA